MVDGLLAERRLSVAPIGHPETRGLNSKQAREHDTGTFLHFARFLMVITMADYLTTYAVDRKAAMEDKGRSRTIKSARPLKWSSQRSYENSNQRQKNELIREGRKAISMSAN